MKGFYTILLLIVSNVFMTFAWYGHLKMKQEYSWFAALPLIGVIAFSWAIAFFEYSCQIPANRIGFIGKEARFHCATKSHSRGNNTCYFYSVHYNPFLKVRLYIGIIWRICLSDCSSVFRVYEIDICQLE